jgi:hypothetical protein
VLLARFFYVDGCRPKFYFNYNLYTIMKKLLCIGVIFFFFTTISQAQVRFGIRAGLNAARWQGEAVQNIQGITELSGGVTSTRTVPGFHAGGYMSLPVTDFFSVEPGLFYSQKGYSMTGNFTSNRLEFLNARATVTNQAHYIDMPLLAKIYLTEGFHLFAGPQVSYLVNNTVRTRASLLGFSLLNQEFNTTGSFERLDVAISGGMGYRFGNGFNLQAGYDYGLRRLDARNNFDTFNRVVKVSLGYEF